MGLFDDYNDPNSYGASGSYGGGGLIDRIMSQLGIQSQYDPNSAGFPQSPMNANAAAPAQQNAPIAVGDYMMPRVGDWHGYPQIDPQTGATVPPQTAQQPMGVPQMAAPMQPQQQAPQPVPQAAPQISPGGFGGAFRGVAANAQGGLLGMALGGIGGALGMGQGTPEQQAQAQKQQDVVQQFRAFVAAGIPQNQALVAALNPKAAEKILDQKFGKDKYTVSQTGEDSLGRKTYQVFNSSTGEFKDIPKPAGQQATDPLGNTELTGDKYLASLPADQQRIVKGLIDGTVQPPSSFAAAKPYWQQMLSAAKNVDPTFDTVNYGARAAGAKDFSAGKSSEMVRSANQTLHHVGQLLGSMDALGNGSNTFFNYAGNKFNESMRGTGEQGAFRTNAHAVAEELSKVFKGSNLSDAEIHSWESNLNENMSPDQQHAQIAKLRDLLQGSLQALEEKRLTAFGPAAAAKQGPLIKEEGQQVLDRIDGWLKGQSGTPATTAPAAGATKTGVKWSVVQ